MFFEEGKLPNLPNSRYLQGCYVSTDFWNAYGFLEKRRQALTAPYSIALT